MRERNSNSRTAWKAAAGGGAAVSNAILDFEFLSRPRSAKQTMEKSAFTPRLICREPGQLMDRS